MEIIVLILLSLSNGDVYNKVLVMPTPSQKDCLAAGATWMNQQDPKTSPQYLCAVKSNVTTDTVPVPPAASEESAQGSHT